MEKYEIAISIPVHEKPEIIMDQIYNINKFVENAAIILHISKDFLENFKKAQINLPQNVYIDDKNIRTGWGDIYLAHILNFEFAKKIIDFRYFILHASNDMYIKKGINRYIEKFDAGYNIRKTSSEKSLWWPSHEAKKDPFLLKMLSKINSKHIIGSQVEGSFYKKEIFEEICKIILDTGKSGFINFRNYPKEEIYFSSLAKGLFPEAIITCPTTFSEVHRYDKLLWKSYLFITNKFKIKRCGYVLDDKRFVNLNSKLFKFKFLYKLRKKDIIDILNNRLSSKNLFINDYSDVCQLYLYSKSLFSVKRVNREYNDKIRKYIRSID